jgi:hypothetical protein
VTTQPPPEGSRLFLRTWESVRDSVVLPANLSALGDDPATREEFLEGARLLRLMGERARVDKRTRKPMTPRPAQLLIADAVAGADRFLPLLAPRRSTKTSALLALAVGRISKREDYRVHYTMATTALKARNRFETDVRAPIEHLYPDARTRPLHLDSSGGKEKVTCRETGSLLQFGAPKGDAYRSDAWDLIIVDEAGEAEPDMTEDLLAGALSTMDTIPDALFIAAGTAGATRDGNLLWRLLEDGRAKRNRTGIVEWAVADDALKVEDLETWGDGVPHLLAVHPGIGHGSTLEDIEPSFTLLGPARFAAEYLGKFGSVGTAAFLDQVKWANGADGGSVPALSELPKFTLAFQVSPDSARASIVAAWRDDDDHACGLVVYSDPIRGLQKTALAVARKYSAPIAYDSGSSTTDSEAQKLARARPRPRMLPQNWSDVSTAAALLARELEAENVRHWAQPDLDGAAAIATKRGVRDSKRWAYGRPGGEGDITALEAFSIALRAYDEAPPRIALVPSTAA